MLWPVLGEQLRCHRNWILDRGLAICIVLTSLEVGIWTSQTIDLISHSKILFILLPQDNLLIVRLLSCQDSICCLLMLSLLLDSVLLRIVLSLML